MSVPKFVVALLAVWMTGCAAKPPVAVSSPSPTPGVPASLLRQLDNAEGEVKAHAYQNAARHSEDLLKQLKLFQSSQEAQIRAHLTAASAYLGWNRKNKAIPHYRALVRLDPAHAAEYKRALRKLGH